MHTSQAILRLGASVLGAASIANAAYTIKDSFDTSNFFEQFTFFTGGDPTHGSVDYQAMEAANSSGLAGISSNAVYLGVDSTTQNPNGGRDSVRVSSNNVYTHGLFIADIAHMPGSTCGVWPAFWTFGVNDQTTDSITLHTGEGCVMDTSGSTSDTVLVNGDCGVGGGYQGCGVTTTNVQGYGDGFNNNQGGVYAMEWTPSRIAVHFFPRNSIPADITSGKPTPASWPTPTASFSGGGCNIDQHFMNHQIIFDTTFCGDWAGQVWAKNTKCSALASTCQDYVGQNPSAFSDSYWLINSVKVYEDPSVKKRDSVPISFSA